ncbi:MAG TPA: glycosyl hydrolase [Terriglobales bacterium]|nr:glycosyl hydrolase [Terriglobales bacterium]
MLRFFVPNCGCIDTLNNFTPEGIRVFSLHRSRAVRLNGMVLVFGLLCFSALTFAQAQGGQDQLKAGFQHPPASARPRVWWHWMNGNITKEGIKLDLEWMHRVGIAGYQNFDAALQTPQVVEKRLPYMTPEWKDAFKYAIQVGDQFGMEMAIAGSPGWSESGGPWVPAAHGMKKYVWSETLVDGGKPFSGKLAHPPTKTGAFQNMGVREQFGRPAPSLPEYYADATVIAFRVPSTESDEDAAQPKITSSGSGLDPAMLSDGDLEKTTNVPIPESGSVSWIQFQYPSPHTVRAVTYVTKDPGFVEALLYGMAAPEKTLEASDDGQTFRKVVTLEGGRAPEHTVSFAPVKAKYFRVTFKRTLPPPRPAWAEGVDPASFGVSAPAPPTSFEVAELILHSDPRVNHFEEKAAFVPVNDLYQYGTPQVDPSVAIKKSDVIDLTSKMRPDGSLDWTPPEGKWLILRIGYSLQGITNHPATPEATGLEVDKLDRRFVKDYFEKYLDSYKETVGADEMGKKGIQFVINDSWEAGSQNWTDNMLAQFKKLRGYDPTPWLPVLTGRVVESAEQSDRFLWDFRKTIADLIATEHYGQLEETLHERGMRHYGESHESGRAFVADGMEVKKMNEVPMSAMWTQRPGVNKPQYGYNADDRESASVAHLYGQNIAAAESLTAAAAPWAWSPATLKPTADQELLNGINRFVIHESAHQPLVGKAPGLTLGPFGQWFNRNETWAEQAGPWVDYLARSSYMLQQGHFGADLVYFYGEDSNLTAIFEQKGPEIPAGYGFDYINADALIHELSVADGQIVTKSGMQYKVLGLDPYSQHMSLPVLRAIHALVENGAVVAGPKPTDDPSLADDPAEFQQLASQLFGDGTGVHKIGKGTVYAGQSLEDVFAALKLKPDFDYSKQGDSSDVEFAHRRLKTGDIYFVDNRSDHAAVIDATFRVSGKQPELWRAETGSTEPVSFKIADGRTSVPLHLEPWGTVFVVFRKPTTQTSHEIAEDSETKLATVDGPWTINFQSGRGAPQSITMNDLSDWRQNPNPGVKYFSGIGTYIKTIQASPDWFKKGSRLWIDLGDVKNLAVVSVNGKDVGETWHAPYRLDVTSALKPGTNTITIKVVNAWVNRLIGDEQPGATTITFADIKPYKASSPLLPSGLIGPVTVVRDDVR